MGEVHIFDLDANQVAYVFNKALSNETGGLFEMTSENAENIVFSPNELFLAIGTNNEVQIWDLELGFNAARCLGTK